MEIIREGKENRVICTNCCTEYEFNVDDIQLNDKGYYYVKCPICGKKHFIEEYFNERVGGSREYFTREKIKEMIEKYYLKHKEEVDRSESSGDDIGLMMYKSGAEPY